MNQISNSKHGQFDLENRTLGFAKRIRELIKILPKTITNFEYGKQLVRSSGSVGANYIEANEALSKKDFLFRIKIAKKEAKESCYWLMLVEPYLYNQAEAKALLSEVTQLMKIFGKILENSQSKSGFGKL